ncbi:hypothetical protein NX059_003995 [Plenodomus lindquistii]|nr:hypothetical protein NX059_003995 [Plenodomus lindquistii]
MTTTCESSGDPGPPSRHDRIAALYHHRNNFKRFAEQPQSGILQTFGREIFMLLAYAEGEIEKDSRSVDVFLEKHVNSAGRGDASEVDIDSELSTVMGNLRASFFDYDHLLDIARHMATSPTPTKTSMDRYRLKSSNGSKTKRAGNGRLLSSYGRRGEPVPVDVFIVLDDDFDPTARVLHKWLMNPFIQYIAVPLLRRLQRGGIVRGPHLEYDLEDIDSRIIVWIARTIESTLAVFLVAVAIGILGTIQHPGIRIMVMTMFSLGYALLAQLMGSQSIIVYALVAAHFQIMVNFGGR